MEWACNARGCLVDDETKAGPLQAVAKVLILGVCFVPTPPAAKQAMLAVGILQSPARQPGTQQREQKCPGEFWCHSLGRFERCAERGFVKLQTVLTVPPERQRVHITRVYGLRVKVLELSLQLWKHSQGCNAAVLGACRFQSATSPRMPSSCKRGCGGR